MPHREQALQLLKEYTTSESLIRHSMAVEACMRWYAEYFKCSAEELELWGLTGLLHDFDYERYPTPTPPDGHPFAGQKILAAAGYPPEMLRAIMGHATYSGVPRDTLMAKALFAVDELSGLVTATVYVRPDRSILALEPKSVLKRMKEKSFAKGCNRDDINLGAAELGIPMDQHVANVIKAMQVTAVQLGLSGQAVIPTPA